MIKALGFAEFYLHEKYMEPPKKNKIILDVKFYQSNVEKCIEQWEILRDIVDTSIKKLKINSHDKEKIEELEKQFYIRLAY